MNKLHNNLTEGSVTKQLLKFSIPFLITNLIQAFYNIADTVIVGWFVGADGISGVSIGGQVTMVIMNFVVGLATGGTVLVAQYIGAKRDDDVKSTIGTLLSMLIALAVVITAVMLAFGGTVLSWMQTPAEAFEQALVYLNICIAGNIFIFLYNAISAIQRGMGDSKRPLMFISIACATNVVLDLLLVGVFDMKAAGAAVATIISQALSVIISIAYLSKNGFIFDFKISSFKVDRQKLANIIKVGFPSAVQNVIVGFSFILVTVLVNGFGVNASAAVGIAGKFNSVAILPAAAMSMSIASMAGQNIGAGFYDRAQKTLWTGIRISLVIGLTIFALAQLFPAQIMRMFTTDEAVIQMGVVYLRSFCFDYLMVAVVFCVNGLINGAGHTTFSLINGMLCSIFLRFPMAYLFGIYLDMGLAGIGLGAPLASFGSLVLGLAYYKSGKWKNNKIVLNDKKA